VSDNAAKTHKKDHCCRNCCVFINKHLPCFAHTLNLVQLMKIVL